MWKSSAGGSALEIADAPWVVDGATLAQLYRDIGFPTCGANREMYGRFETAEALEAAERVHHELFHPEDPARRMAGMATKALTDVVTNTK